MIEVDRIEEIYPGHYFVILDFPKPNILKQILDDSYAYVWGVEHKECRVTWSNYKHTLFEIEYPEAEILVRNMEMESIVPTKDFLKYIPSINQTVKLIQINSIPPYYLDLKGIQGRTRYELLKKEVDYLFEIDIPGALDYAPMVSSDINFLERVVANYKSWKENPFTP